MTGRGGRRFARVPASTASGRSRACAVIPRQAKKTAAELRSTVPVSYVVPGKKSDKKARKGAQVERLRRNARSGTHVE